MRLVNRKWSRGGTGEDLPLDHLFPWSDWPASSQRTPVGVGSLETVMGGEREQRSQSKLNPNGFSKLFPRSMVKASGSI